MEHQEQLSKLAFRHNLRRKEADDARLALADAIRKAARDGVRQVDIVKATGYTREQIRLIVAGRTR